jgi:hypothetical protein
VSELLVIALLLINLGRVDHRSRVERMISLMLVAVVSLADGASAVQVVLGHHERHGRRQCGARADQRMHRVLANIVVFSLWYWEFDRGGPGKRALGEREYADVMFPQLNSPELARTGFLWVPGVTCTCRSPTPPRSARPPM